MFRLTAMERTEELVQNLLVAQNELILHISILKAVPNLARALFGSVEKNSTSEKNSTPEKNSSEMEKIRQTWMDDVVGLASEFYINEEAFNLDNLTDLLKATVGAITDILALGPEENSVDRTEKKVTFLDKLREDYPEHNDDSNDDIISCYCPSEFGYENPVSEDKTCKECGWTCVKCWHREFPRKTTFREKLAEKHPELINDEYLGGCRDCPGDYWNVPYKINTPSCTWKNSDNSEQRNIKCKICWNMLYKEDPPRTCRERLQLEHPDNVHIMYSGGCLGCPTDYGYIPEEKILCSGNNPHHVHSDTRCTLCWDQKLV